MLFLNVNQVARLLLVVTTLTIWSEKVNSFVHSYLPSSTSSSYCSIPRTNDRCISRLLAAQINDETNVSINGQRTLYEILNSQPDASRSDLKRSYIALVRQTHPDALISRGEPAIKDENPEFQEIMQAWRTLSNPFERKRYDRKLRAAAFTVKVENAVGAIGKTAGPQFLNAFENVAIPFIRRSAAATVAGFTSIGDDISTYGSSNATLTEETGLGGIIANAVQSSRKAGKAIDCLELLEKSRELTKR